MGDLILWLVVMITWFPAGYFAARIINAWAGVFDTHWSNRQYFDFDWNYPVDDYCRFGVRIFFGWLTFIALTLFVSIEGMTCLLLGVGYVFGRIVIALGRFAAPKP